MTWLLLSLLIVSLLVQGWLALVTVRTLQVLLALCEQVAAIEQNGARPARTAMPTRPVQASMRIGGGS